MTNQVEVVKSQRVATVTAHNFMFQRTNPSAQKVTGYRQFAIGLCLFIFSQLTALPAESQPHDDSGFRELLQADEKALDQIDHLLANNEAFARQGAGLNQAAMATKVRALTDPVIDDYQSFLTKHPNHVKAHLAYASFLGQFGRDQEARKHLDEAIKLAPADPVALNNAANWFGEHGPPEKALEYYRKAMAARPGESTYYRNCASVMLLHRPQAVSWFALADEQALFVRTQEYYRKAHELKPDDFLLASDLAQIHYQIKPFPYLESVSAWENALQLAPSRTEKEGVLIHLARIHLQAKQFPAARLNLNSITLPEFLSTKRKLIAGIPVAMKQVEFSTSTQPAKLFNFSTAPPPVSTNPRD